MSQRMSQGSQKSQGTPRTQGTQPDITEAARNVVRFLLMHDFDKHPIKHTDIAKNVLKAHARNTGPIIELARKMLRDVYGLDLIYLDKANKQYIITNALEQQEHVVYPDEVQSQLLLLAIILTFIFMTSGSRDGAVEVVKVHEFLTSLEIYMTEDHEYFGSVKGAIEVLRSQQYLEMNKMEQTDPPKYEYKWGERAYNEFSLRKALELASEMCNVENMERWTAHYKVVTDNE